MRIVLATHGLPFHGDWLKENSLGGSETALLCMAQALAAKGHRVSVYNNCPKPDKYNDVDYQHVSQLGPFLRHTPVDVFIVSRFVDLLLQPVSAGVKVLWLHDICVNGKQMVGNMYGLDRVYALSEFHRQNYLEELPYLDAIMRLSRNGVDQSLIFNHTKPKQKGKLIFTSRPERGLLPLLQKIMPRLIAADPSLKLYYANYDVASLYSQGKMAPEAAQLVKHCEALAATMPNNVIPLGHLTKDKLYAEISSAQLMLYPTSFPEISYIGGMEAQACGTPIVTTNAYAIKETIGPESGILINGSPNSEEYIEEFVNSTLDLLDNNDRYTAMAAAGPKWINDKGYYWSTIAAEWIADFEKIVADRVQANPEKIVQEIVRKNGARQASLVAAKLGVKQEVAIRDAEPLTTQKVLKAWKAVMNVGHTACELLNLDDTRVQPKKILDLDYAETSIGVVLAKKLPESKVNVFADSQEYEDQLRRRTTRSPLENLEYGHVPDSTYDLVCITTLESKYDPREYVREAIRQYSTKDGWVCVVTPRVPADPRFKDYSCTQQWNFDFEDIYTMFSCVPGFQTTFVYTGMTRNAEVEGYWVTLFKADASEIKGAPISDKIKRTRPYQSVTACMIVRDCAKWLPLCFDNFSKYVDHIVVVDNGSTDDTVEVATRLGAEVRQVPFDNFSQVRNESIRDCKTDWIFWIDADELLIGGYKLRHYLDTAIYNGFAIRQNHLTLDTQKSHDSPVRLFRNSPNYKFTGYIHEQCEDVSKKPFEDKIQPVLVIPDIDLGHLGYINERHRRWKCTNRNLELLLRDAADNAPKGRVLTWVLISRDYLNFAKWTFERLQGAPIQYGSPAHDALEAAVLTHWGGIMHCENEYKEISDGQYQEVLRLMGACSLPFRPLKMVPFEIGLQLTGCVGGLQNRDSELSTRWFVHRLEYEAFMRTKCEEVGFRLEGISYDSPEIWDYKPDVPDPEKILRQVVEMFPDFVEI